jgi:hypothetical protein
MPASFGRHESLKLRADAESVAHPMWRKCVAGALALVFAFILASFGLMLCIAPMAAP